MLFLIYLCKWKQDKYEKNEKQIDLNEENQIGKDEKLQSDPKQIEINEFVEKNNVVVMGNNIYK
jgi:hypothetical protein